jgi:hypothetical protein
MIRAWEETMSVSVSLAARAVEEQCGHCERPGSCVLGYLLLSRVCPFAPCGPPAPPHECTVACGTGRGPPLGSSLAVWHSDTVAAS